MARATGPARAASVVRRPGVQRTRARACAGSAPRHLASHGARRRGLEPACTDAPLLARPTAATPPLATPLSATPLPFTVTAAQDRAAWWLDGERQWGRLLSAALLHGSLLPALWCADGLRNAGAWLELACGRLQALIMFACAAAGAAAAQLWLNDCAACVSGAGLATGAYTAWAALAATRLRGEVPLTSDRGLLYLALNAAAAWHQPAVGLPCLAGGAAGGALGALAAPALARIAYAAAALPVVLTLAAARLAIETAKLAAAAAVVLLAATWRAGAEAVRTVRGL